MQPLTRITLNPQIMGGKPCIRGMRVTVGTIIGLLAAGYTSADILQAYPYLEEADIYEALVYAAWRVEEQEVSREHLILSAGSRHETFHSRLVLSEVEG